MDTEEPKKPPSAKIESVCFPGTWYDDDDLRELGVEDDDDADG